MSDDYDYLSDPECENALDEWFAYECARERSLAWRGAWMGFRDFRKYDNSHIGFVGRWFYPLKVLICVALNLREKVKHGERWKRDDITVSVPHCAKLYAGWEEDSLEVGAGVFRNWFYNLQHDGDWEM